MICKSVLPLEGEQAREPGHKESPSPESLSPKPSGLCSVSSKDATITQDIQKPESKDNFLILLNSAIQAHLTHRVSGYDLVFSGVMHYSSLYI